MAVTGVAAFTATSTFAGGYSIAGGPTVDKSMGQLYSNIGTSSITTTSTTFATINTLTLANAGPYWCTFRAMQTGGATCNFQISSPAGTPLGNSALQTTTASVAYTDAAFTATAGQTIVVEWAYVSGLLQSCATTTRALRCLNTIANN